MEVVPAAKPQKRPLGDENAAGDDDAQDAAKKPRAAAPPAAAAETATTLTKDQQKLAIKWRERRENAKDCDVEAFALKPKESEVQAVVYVTRVLDMTKGKGKNHITALALCLNPSHKALKKKGQLAAVKSALGDASTVAFLAASAPPPKKIEEEGHVEGSVDVKLAKGDDVWRRYRDAEAAGLGTPGVSPAQIREALKRIRANPKSTYAEDRGFEVRDVTDATRCATATNKVVRGVHEEKMRPGTYERKTLTERLAGPEEEERKAKAALAAAAKEQKVAYRKGQYDYFGLKYSSVPPLPKGATEADRERLQREALEAFYGRSASSS